MEPNRPDQSTTRTNSSTVWTIISIVVVVAIIVGIYFLTRNIKKDSDMVDNNSLETNSAEILGADRTEVTAAPKSLTVTNMGTFPYKVQAKALVDLPNSCSSAVGNVTQSGKIFTINVVASQPKDAVCAQVITSTTVTVDLPVAGLAAGTYTVNYGTFSKTFTLAQNNTVEYTSDK